jgi:hypothetical protein
MSSALSTHIRKEGVASGSRFWTQIKKAKKGQWKFSHQHQACWNA